MFTWNVRDKLKIRCHSSQPGRGLSYKTQIVTACEDGFTGGWDVFEGINENGNEIAFYGFSVEEIN